MEGTREETLCQPTADDVGSPSSEPVATSIDQGAGSGLQVDEFYTFVIARAGSTP